METTKLKKFELSALSDLDGGRVNIAFNQALSRVIGDCEDRPGEKTARTVTMQLAVVPVLDESGVCDDAKVQIVITDSVPKRKTRVYDMALKKNQKGASLLFRPDSLDEVEQDTFDFGANG